MIGLKQRGNRLGDTFATVFPIVASAPHGAVTPAGLLHDHGHRADADRPAAVVTLELIQTPPNRFGADHDSLTFSVQVGQVRGLPDRVTS